MAPNKTVAKAVTVATAATAVFALAPVTSAGADELSLLGTWTGQRERIASTEGYRQGSATLIVTEQTGLTFRGAMRWSTPEGDVQEDLVGAFTPDGTLIAGSDLEGSYSFTLVGPTTLDYCYSEHGEGYRTTCARLEKQP